MKDNKVIGADSFLVRLRRELGILLFISLVGLAIRLPFFFPAVIDWDESTFIIIGQSAVDGFLPNEIAWDVKPAFVFWWYGGAIELFGKTIPAMTIQCIQPPCVSRAQEKCWDASSITSEPNTWPFSARSASSMSARWIRAEIGL